MKPPPVAFLEQRATHRLIPARYLEEPTVLARISDDRAHLEHIFELDNATNEGLLCQEDLMPGIGREELVFGIPNDTVINAAFTHPAPDGGRFNGPDRGAWYAGFALETAQREVACHKTRHYLEILWDAPETTRYQDMLADFTAWFHDCRGQGFAEVLAPDSHAASQRLAASLLAAGSAGIVYPSVRHAGGACIACFRPALVNNVRHGQAMVFCWQGLGATAYWNS